MNLFLRHKASSTFLVMYVLWWGYALCVVFARRKANPSYDFTAPGLFFSTIFITGFLALGLLIRYLFSKDDSKKDYLIFIAIIVFPVLLFTLATQLF